MCKKLIYLVSFVVVLSIAGNASAELVAYWKFDEGSGTIAYDSSGNGNDGTFNGDPQWVPGHFGYALEFDGSGDWLDCGTDPSLGITGAVSISAWIKVSAQGVDHKIGGNQDGANGGYKMTVYSNNKVEFEIRTSSNSDVLNRDVGGGTILEVDVWYHVAGVYSLEDGYIRTYVDGVLDRELLTTQALGASPGSFKIGCEPFTTGSYNFNGVMDDVRLYNHALTEGEILGAMEGGEGWPYALSPTPADGTLHADTWASLSWRAGDFAVSHDVYFGENFDDVDDGAPGTFRGNQTRTVFTVGIAGSPYPDGLVPGTTYYWRIDEVEADGTTVHKGDVWNFTITRGGGGLQGNYYQWSGNFPPSRSAAFSNLVLTRIDPKINFNWDNSAPGASVNADNFSVRWTGEVEAAFTETYTFYTTTDDGVRLWVSDEQIIDKWVEQIATEWSGTIDLVAGQMYSIVMEYYENSGEAVAQLRWSSPHTPKQLVPQAALSPPAGAGVAVGVIELTDATFDQTVLRSELPVLVDFWAPWCGPCLIMAPVIEEIADEYAGKVKVCKLNVDNEPQTTSNYGIIFIPTFILFKDGQAQRQWVGVTSKNIITAAIDKLLYPSQPTGLVIELTDATFDNTIYTSDVPVLVFFSAPWCVYCGMMEPIVQEIADEYAGQAKICVLNIDDSPHIATNYGISAIPTLLLFKDGTSQKKWVGVTGKDVITDAIDELL